MKKNKMLTADQIRSMSDAEWNKFRNNSWNNKKAYYDKPMPETYLKNKDQFVAWLERNKRRVKTLNPEKIKAMSESEWNEYRNNSWNRKKEYYNKPMPDTYLKNKDYIVATIERKSKK